MELAIVHRKSAVVGMFFMNSWRNFDPFSWIKADRLNLTVTVWKMKDGDTVASTLQDFHTIQLFQETVTTCRANANV